MIRVSAPGVYRNPRFLASVPPRILIVLLATVMTVSSVAAAVPGPIPPGTEVPGRILLELTEAGARALRDGRLVPPVLPGGTAARLEPLFISRTGPLARYAVLSFEASPAAWFTPDPNRDVLAVLRAEPWTRRAQSDLVLPVAALPDDPYLLG